MRKHDHKSDKTNLHLFCFHGVDLFLFVRICFITYIRSKGKQFWYKLVSEKVKKVEYNCFLQKTSKNTDS